MPGLLTAKELREKRANLHQQAQEVLDQAAKEGRDKLSAEEQQKFDAYHGEMEQVRSQYEAIERHEQVARELAESQGVRAGRQDTEERREDRKGRTTVDGLRAWMTDPEERSDEQRQMLREMGANSKEFRVNLMTSEELRAQATGTDAAGGYTVPQGFRNVLEEAMLAFGGVRQSRATVLRTASGNQIEIPTVNDTGNVGALLAENTQDSEQDVTFGQAVLDAYKYTSKIIRVSKELMQDSAFDMSAYLGRALGERLGRITAQHFTTGTGSAQPAGVVTGATLGVTTGAGDVADFTYDNLIALFHSVDPAYRNAAEWMMSDAAVKVLRQLKDANNLPIWQPGTIAGAPDRLFGKPIVINQEVADPAASAKSILFGDFSKFFIRDVLDVSLVRMDERYADYHQVAFVAISRHDSVLVDAGTAPIKYLQHAAA